MAGAHEEKEPAAAGGRSRPGEVRKSAVVHATARRYVDVQERALPQALRDYRRAERRVSGVGRRPSPPIRLSCSSQSRCARHGYRSTRRPAFPSKRARKSCLASQNFFTPHFYARFPPVYPVQRIFRQNVHFASSGNQGNPAISRKPLNLPEMLPPANHLERRG